MRSPYADRLQADTAAVVDAWIRGLRTDPACRPGERIDDLEELAPDLLGTLAAALENQATGPSSDAAREVVKEFAHLGGWLASRGATPTLMARLVPTLSEAVAVPPGMADPALAVWRSLLDGLAVAVAETYCGSLRSVALSREASLLEDSTPLITLPGGVPVLLVIGSPSRHVLSLLLARLLMEVACHGADVVWIDLSKATRLPDLALELLPDFAREKHILRRHLLITAVHEAQREHLAAGLNDLPNVQLLASWKDGLAWLETHRD
jgi:hypothetical protein